MLLFLLKPIRKLEQLEAPGRKTDNEMVVEAALSP